jgi:phage-related protein
MGAFLMQKLTFTNERGQTVELGGAPFILSKIDGLGDVDATLQLQKAPSQHGSTYTGSVLSERTISLEVTITGFDREDISVKRELLSSVFNPTIKGLVKFENGRVTRWIEAVSEHVPIFPSGIENRTYHFQKSMISLMCPSPFWLTEEMVDQLVVWEGGLEFPLELPTFFAQQSESKAKIVANEGDVQTPVMITFNGPATAPIRIENQTTGEFVEVNQSLLAGERMEISTAFGQKRVTKVLADGTRLNAFHFISLDSTFFQLQPGNNLLAYSTGMDYEQASVIVSWRNRHLSV